MTDRVAVGSLQVARVLYDFVNDEALPGTGVAPEVFWSGLDRIIHDLAPKNRALLDKRDHLQAEIDRWHRERRGSTSSSPNTRPSCSGSDTCCLREPDFPVSTANVDPEIAEIAGPQLVVPVMNARYALNAANARWGSLYDALYGTDAIPEDGGATRGKGYNPERGKRVIAFARERARRGCAARRRVLEGRDRALGCGRTARGQDGHRGGVGLKDAVRLRGLPGKRDGALARCCCGTTACISRSSSTAVIRSARAIRRASPTSSSRRR